MTDDVNDRANEAGEAHHEERLSRLDDFEVADGYPDIRGWPVRGSNGRELGVVGDLLVDMGLLEVSALDVHLGVGAAGVRGNVIGSARVPIESAQLRPDRYVVVDVDVIPCEDVLVPADDGTGAMRRVPCGQIGIRRRAETAASANVAPRDVEVQRASVVADRASAAEGAAGATSTGRSPGDASGSAPSA